ncbi:hypothetical protein GY45DRAFT_1071157 [Cubamyces sp. BRFM 1775]|nr:hypothetical protein GY45DRAFT_1071157 [Cubamyces sp. BRFM 1775]
MIVNKSPLPGDEVNIEPEDAPPSYDASVDAPPPLPRDEKAGTSSTRSTQSTTQNASVSPISPISPPSHKDRGKRPASTSWFNFGPTARAAKEVRATIKGLLRDLVKQTDAQGALGVLESCAEACRTYDLSLSALLQERSIEGHTPLYWSIINRASPESSDAPSPTPTSTRESSERDRDVVMALLSHAAPLSDSTVDEIRLACLHASDHGLFQRLRRSPAFSPLSGSDELIIGGTVPVDDVEVEDVPGDEAGFVVHFRIPMFQKRMRISQEITLEFIAKGRLWSLRFLVVKEMDSRLSYQYMRAGSWVVALSLLSHSPPTWIDSRLVIEDPRARTTQPPSSTSASTSSSTFPSLPSPQTSSGPPTSLSEAVEGMVQHVARESEGPLAWRDKPKPKIELRIKRSEQLTAPTSTRSTHHPVIAVSLEEDVRANSLQFKGCPYIESDGSLLARLEARLVQPGSSDCIIC